jgi:hypothetical protein
MVKAGLKGKVTAAPGSVEAAEGRQGSCRRVHRRVHHHTGGTGLETAELRALQRQMTNGLFDVPRIA